jgi:hypothetical protein
MLRRKPIRHFTNDLDKSWTADDFLDLVVWYEATERIFGFQLCYDRYDEPGLARVGSHTAGCEPMETGHRGPEGLPSCNAAMISPGVRWFVSS